MESAPNSDNHDSRPFFFVLVTYYDTEIVCVYVCMYENEREIEEERSISDKCYNPPTPLCHPNPFSALLLDLQFVNNFAS